MFVLPGELERDPVLGAQACLDFGRIERTQYGIFSADEGADVGADEGTPVTEAYKVPFKFTGKISKVTIDLKEDNTRKTDLEEADRARKEAIIRKAMAN